MSTTSDNREASEAPVIEAGARVLATWMDEEYVCTIAEVKTRRNKPTGYVMLDIPGARHLARYHVFELRRVGS